MMAPSMMKCSSDLSLIGQEEKRKGQDFYQELKKKNLFRLLFHKRPKTKLKGPLREYFKE